MTPERYLEYCRELPGALIDRPFAGDETTIARHQSNGRWFAALMRRGGRDFVNLKCDPMEGALLRSDFAGITPGYHMNKEHWISVSFCANVPDSLIFDLTDKSHALTRPKRLGKDRQ